MNITIKTDFKNKILFANRKTVLSRIGKMLDRNISNRTLNQNVDIDGKGFKDYNTQYAKYREHNSLSRKPNLVKSNQMMGSFGILKLTNNVVEVGVRGGHNQNKAGWNENMGREFLGVSKSDDIAITNIVDRYVTDELRNL